MQDKIDLKSLTLEELKEQITALGEKGFRAGQIYRWLHQRKVSSFDEMTDQPAAFRAQLEQRFYINRITVKKKLVSKIDGTVKYLYQLRDGNCVETVLMQYKHGASICISSQAGCRMGCQFCASTLAGLERSLTASELLDQVYMTEQDSGYKIDSIVMMGIGEPLDNYDNVVRFLRLISSPEGMNLSLRHLSLSTCGLVDRIYDLAQLKLGLTLSISLHATDDETRSKIMPVNKKYPLSDLMKACRDYFAITGRRISFEYALIEGVNDTPAQATALAKLLNHMNCHVNLIPVNPVKERAYRRSTPANVARFQQQLTRLGVNATVRRELGSDINAACGQLRRESVGKEGSI